MDYFCIKRERMTEYLAVQDGILLEEVYERPDGIIEFVKGHMDIRIADLESWNCQISYEMEPAEYLELKERALRNKDYC